MHAASGALYAASKVPCRLACTIPPSGADTILAGRFKARKGAAGDTKGTSKVEPYAYWPLDRKLLNRRPGKKADAVQGLARVVKGPKGGVQRGNKAKRLRKA